MFDDDFIKGDGDSFDIGNSADLNLPDEPDAVTFEDGTEIGSDAVLPPDSPELPDLDNHLKHENTDFTHGEDQNMDGDNGNYHEVFTGKSGHSDINFQGGLGICGIQCLNGCTSILTEDNQHLTYSELSEHNR